jgi:hypothetical protein
MNLALESMSGCGETETVRKHAPNGAVRGSDLESVKQSSRGVAQPGSAPALGAE